ncbi:hypothetical protein A8709_08115 [Paenibacillus pectinilyticus]|uniref:ABM domain-containing protein n=1 Tax=Paenibacillus pectinilyticus TaxID=512399 RepID=A0A1C1A7Q4_9BACL|nr:hypothetical protein [Paenibacillus pectinilyticus]OCT16631.1 hypothetical protein A8709_08115 [Paenibacillus pectinilyticus]
MSKVFVEYAIKPECRNSFLIYMQGIKQREGRLELLEGTDQEGLYVEIWNEVTYEEYLKLKQERLQGSDHEEERGDWDNWVQGGLKKVHMWHFSEVAST